MRPRTCLPVKAVSNVSEIEIDQVGRAAVDWDVEARRAHPRRGEVGLVIAGIEAPPVADDDRGQCSRKEGVGIGRGRSGGAGRGQSVA